MKAPAVDESHLPAEPIRYVCRFTLEEIEAMASTGVVPLEVRDWFRHGDEVLRGERVDFTPRPR